jgi:hypothetical protein
MHHIIPITEEAEGTNKGWREFISHSEGSLSKGANP